MSKVDYLNYMDSIHALSMKNADIQYASTEIKRFAQCIFEQAIKERDEARRLAEEWKIRYWTSNADKGAEACGQPPFPWEVDDGS